MRLADLDRRAAIAAWSIESVRLVPLL